jgi:hypothetical protein
MLPKMRNRLLLAILAVSTTCSCGPAFRPYDKSTNEQAYAAPLVVVGLAENDEEIGGPTPKREDPGDTMQLHRVTVHVENVLKGAVPQRTISVYYFAFVGVYYGATPLIFGKEPSRRFLWLRKDKGQYRMACDGCNCTAPIMSGAHPGFKMTPGEPIERAMTDLLLTRGEGPVDDRQFAQEIERGAPDRSDSHVIEKLRHLALTESPEVKYAACRYLFNYTRGGPDDNIHERAVAALTAAKCTCAMERGIDIVCQ